MTSPVRPEEISAFLDGELTPVRAEEVGRAIAEDPKLREAYRQLAAIDGKLNSYAAACQFSPCLSMAGRPPVPDGSIAAVVCGLVAVRILAKLLPLGAGIGLQLAALALLVAWLVWQLLPGVQVDRRQISQEMGLNPISG